MISLVIPHLRTLPLLALKRSELLSIPPTTRSFIVTSRSNTVLASLLAAVATVVGPGHLSFQQAPFALRPARSPVIDPCGQSRCTIDLASSLARSQQQLAINDRFGSGCAEGPTAPRERVFVAPCVCTYVHSNSAQPTPCHLLTSGGRSRVTVHAPPCAAFPLSDSRSQAPAGGSAHSMRESTYNSL
jgi:hypothetical protein